MVGMCNRRRLDGAASKIQERGSMLDWLKAKLALIGVCEKGRDYLRVLQGKPGV